MITNTELAWLAGLFDGEGCFCVRIMNRGRNLKSIGSIHCKVTVQATSKVMIDQIELIYIKLGIRYALDGPRMMARSKKPAYKIEVFRKADVENILSTVLKYLVVKKSEAALILAFYEKHRDTQHGNQYTGAFISNEEKNAFVDVVRQAKLVA